MMREKQLPWSIFIGVSLTFVDNFLFLESGILYFVLHFCYLFRSPDFISESGILNTRTLFFSRNDFILGIWNLGHPDIIFLRNDFILGIRNLGNSEIILFRHDFIFFPGIRNVGNPKNVLHPKSIFLFFLGEYGMLEFYFGGFGMGDLA